LSIVTIKGDDGKTSLYLGGRVKKSDPRMELCGTMDELCSFLGVAKSLIKDKPIRMTLEEVQRDLFLIGQEVVTNAALASHLKNRLGEVRIGFLERAIEKFEQKDLKGFCLPGEDFTSSVLDVSRTVTRRAERLAVTLKNKSIFKNKHALVYLNRLSDLLYILAREHEKRTRRLKSGRKRQYV
jgi:ATP:cob(I)alamin adenosyltransferase